MIDGDVQRAAQMLGRSFHVDGVVIHNSHFGRTIGFPTANIEPPVDQVALADGIYAAFCRVAGDERVLPAVTYIGTRPTVNTGLRQIETNVLDFSEDLYGRRIRVEFIKRLRPDQTFSSLELMVEQLHRDKLEARQVLAEIDRTA